MTKDEALKKAFKQAFQLGQDYWYQADHEFESQNKKSDVTRAKFEQLMEDAIKEALAQPAVTESHKQDPLALEVAIAVLDHCYGHGVVSDDMIESTAKVVSAAIAAHGIYAPTERKENT